VTGHPTQATNEAASKARFIVTRVSPELGERAHTRPIVRPWAFRSEPNL